MKEKNMPDLQAKIMATICMFIDIKSKGLSEVIN